MQIRFIRRQSYRLAALFAASMATSVSVSHAATSFTYPTFGVTAHDTSNIASVPLAGATAGTMYNGYTVSLDWTAGANLPQSHEASLALVSTPPPQSASSVFHADPGAAPNSRFNGNPYHLNWGGPLDVNYAGGNPLNFWYTQAFASSTANWSNINVTLYSYTTLTSGFAGNTTGGPTWRRPNTTAALSNTGTAVPYQVVPFTVDTTGPYAITTTTVGYDGYLGIYDSSFSATDQLTNVLALNDDGSDPGNNSKVDVALTAGHSYFLVQSGFANSDFGAWTAEFNGIGNVVVPEPAGAVLLGIAGVALRRRPVACDRH